MAKYALNQAAVENCRRLIDARQYVLNSDWGEVQPRADEQNAFLERHSWEEYAAWHLGLTEGVSGETKADRLRLPRIGMAAQGDRARGARSLASPGHHFGLTFFRQLGCGLQRQGESQGP